MRIAGYIEHPNMKITVFQLDNRFAVKFEVGMYEQTFKFRQAANTDSLADLKKTLGVDFQEKVLVRFNEMHKQAMAAQRALASSEQDEFEEII